MERQVTEAGLTDRVLFTGMLEGAGRASAIARADVFVVPSYSEVIGLTVLEAMAGGRPVVLTQGCQFPEAELSNAAEVVEAEGPALASAILRLLDDPSHADAMAQRGFRLVQGNYTWPAAARRVRRMYDQAAKATTQGSLI